MAKNEEFVYPEIEPFNSGYLKVSDLHEIYYEESGSKEGKPAIYIHGGPGGGSSLSDHRYFNPKKYHTVVFDQRGSGKSKPAAELEDNHPRALVSDIGRLRVHLGVEKWVVFDFIIGDSFISVWGYPIDNHPCALVADIERLRVHLGVEKWVVFGGSWGSTLSLLYAEAHPDRVIALVLRGIFTLRRKELLWYYQDGCSNIFPDYYEEYIKPIPEVERHDLMSAYYRRLTGSNEEEKLACARAWSSWEMATSRLHVDKDLLKRADSDIWSLQFARIECHYFVHGGFFTSDSQVLDNVHKIRHIPCTIVQGRYDVVCPAKTAWDLHKAFPEAELIIVPDSGHSAREAGTKRELVKACDKYADL